MLQVDIHGHLYVGKWQPIMAIKLSKDQGILHFLNMADVSRLVSLGFCIYLGQPHQLIFLLIKDNKLNTEQSE